MLWAPGTLLRNVSCVLPRKGLADFLSLFFHMRLSLRQVFSGFCSYHICSGQLSRSTLRMKSRAGNACHDISSSLS